MKKRILLFIAWFTVCNAGLVFSQGSAEDGEQYAEDLEAYLNATYGTEMQWVGESYVEQIIPGLPEYPYWAPDNQLGIRTNPNISNAHVGINCLSDPAIQLKVGGFMASSTLQSEHIGVGSAPDSNHRLYVNGSIYANDSVIVNNTLLAKEVKIQSNITSDYVFNDDYKLMSIDELEAYLKANKHLPGVPSVEEAKVKGQNLGEMDDILLRKIEELHLYVLQLKKQMEAGK